MYVGSETICALMEDQEEIFRDELNTLVKVRLIDGDIKRELEFFARCHIRRIVKTMEDEYKEKYQVPKLPDMMGELMYTRAYLNYVRHCACLMKDLKLAAFDPEKRI
ncbi:MAG: hypothetical protein ACRBDL_08625 [Alphaproteobacteria bacterium]